MDVGIYAPYGPHEVTIAALRVAEEMLRQGCNPRWLAPSPVLKGVHPYWDQRVQVCDHKTVYLWARGCSKLIWFDHRPRLLRQTKLVTAHAKQIYVARLHHLPQGEGNLAGYDRVICPTKTAYQLILDNFAVCEERLTWCFWESGLTPICGSLQHPAKIYMPVDSYTCQVAGTQLAILIGQLLGDYRKLEVTVNSPKAWDPGARRLWRKLHTAYSDRLDLQRDHSLIHQLSDMHQHAITFHPALRAEFGLTATRSLACGTPVIVHDVFPFTGLIRHNQDGLLIQCGLTTTKLGVPTATFDLRLALTTLRHFLDRPASLQVLRASDWQLERRRQSFQRCWSA